MPSVSACMSTLNLRFNKMKSNLKELMAKQTYVCSTADVWSHRARSYLGVSIHFIDADWKRHSYILAFKHLKERHTFDYLAKCLQAIYKDFDLPIDKITHAITDGGSNFCKAFREFGVSNNIQNSFEIHEEDSDQEDDIIVVDDQTLIILEGDDVSEDEIVAKEMQNEIDRITIHSEQIDFSEAESLDDEINLPKQMRCFAHLLNLIGIYFLSVSYSWTCKIICILY